MRQTLANYFKAAFPCVAIQTTEEARACEDVIFAAKQLGRGVVTWSATEGMVDVTGNKALPDTNDLMAACYQRRESTVFIMRDPHTWPLDRDPVLARAFRDFLASAPAQGSTVVILAPEFKPQSTVEKLVVVLDYELPGPDDLKRIALNIAESAGKEIEPTEEVVRALSGLTTTEAENALSLSLVETRGFDPRVIYREKCKAVKKSGLLEVVTPDPRGLEAVGGLDVLKTWINRRRRVWSPEAAEFGVKPPKGVMLVGVPGAGKSLSAKAIGTALAIPTLRLDIGTLFNSLVGESEARTRDALKLAEALAPCVLWVDEIDKGLAGSSGSGSGDSGVTRRVFGNIISWMQERRRPVFLVATANQVEGLPPELLRKGRFDEVFAVDLPNAAERREIFAIHIRGCDREPSKFDLEMLSRVTNEFTGSEIATVIDDGLVLAFDAGHQLCTDDLLSAAQQIVPLATTAKEQIAAIRAWASTRARFASTPEIKAAETPGLRRLSK